MRTIGNVLWLVFGGLVMAIGYALAAFVMFVLIVTIPFGVQALKLASFSLWPFGRTLVTRRDAGGAALIGNIVWVLLAGWWLAFGHLISASILVVTIIGIPFAVAHVKLAGAALWPFGREIVPLSSYPHPSPGIVVSR